MTYEDFKIFVDAAKAQFAKEHKVTFQGLVDAGVKLLTINELRLEHIVGGKDDSMFIAWHTNKFYPDATIDRKMSLLKPHDFSEVYQIIDDIVKDTTKENELTNMYSLKKALDTL